MFKIWEQSLYETCGILQDIFDQNSTLNPSLLSLASQTHFRKKGMGLVNCIYKPGPTGMQLDYVIRF